jgi:hypothetical protein
MGWLTSAGTTVAIILGLYGAILSTINYRQHRRELERHITVTARIGSLHSAPGNPNPAVARINDAPGNPYANLVLLKAVNPGYRTVTISVAGFRLPNGSRQPLTQGAAAVGLPFEVYEGKAQVLPVPAQELARELRALGVVGKVRLVGYFADPLDHLFESQPFEFDVDAWSAETTP